MLENMPRAATSLVAADEVFVRDCGVGLYIQCRSNRKHPQNNH